MKYMLVYCAGEASYLHVSQKFPSLFQNIEQLPRVTYNMLDENFVVDDNVDFNNRELFYYIDSFLYFEEIYSFLTGKGVLYENIIKRRLEPRVISLSNQKVLINEEIMSLPSVPLNIDNSFENLVCFKNVCDEFEIDYFLAFGTLLGFYRDNNFITYDSDSDIGILDKDRVKLFSALLVLINSGFKIIRFTDNLISISKNNDYIDVYIFKLKKYWNKKIWNCNGFIYPFETLESWASIEYKNVVFRTPSNLPILMESLYGKSWKVPIKNKHSKPNDYVPPTIIEKIVFVLTKFLER